MTRIYSDYAYGPGPRDGCWWDETIPAPDWPVLQGDQMADVAIVGGGFTGVSAALHLAEAGVSVALLEAETPGFGASGRNGGFCCLGGARISDAALLRMAGQQAAQDYRRAELDAVSLVANLLARHDIGADTHSSGETQLAHRPTDMDSLRRKADAMAHDGLEPVLIEPKDLDRHGMRGPFYGALTTPVGFGLNPRKYLFGLARAAAAAGADLYQKSRVLEVCRDGGVTVLRTDAGQARARSVLFATNGYSSENLPHWLAGRYLPTQSNVLVTRPLSDAELSAQGWTSDQMCYDTRGLLHYFRLMPDRRFLFGMRGGLIASARAEARARARVRADFETMFPAWAHVESPNTWSGLVCLSRNGLPFAGPVPDQPGQFAGLAYHGNGIAMGTFTGRLLAGLALGKNEVPAAMQLPMARFPLGRARRLLMVPVYIAHAIRDRQGGASG